MKERLNIVTQIYNKTSFDLNLTVTNQIRGKILITANLKVKLGSSYRRVLRFQNLDYCKFLNEYDNKNDLNFFKSIFENIFSGTFISNCPLNEGFYYVRKGFVALESVRSFVIPGSFYKFFFEMNQLESELLPMFSVIFHTKTPK